MASSEEKRYPLSADPETAASRLTDRKGTDPSSQGLVPQTRSSSGSQRETKPTVPQEPVPIDFRARMSAHDLVPQILETLAKDEDRCRIAFMKALQGYEKERPKVLSLFNEAAKLAGYNRGAVNRPYAEVVLTKLKEARYARDKASAPLNEAANAYMAAILRWACAYYALHKAFEPEGIEWTNVAILECIKKYFGLTGEKILIARGVGEGAAMSLGFVIELAASIAAEVIVSTSPIKGDFSVRLNREESKVEYEVRKQLEIWSVQTGINISEELGVLPIAGIPPR